MTFVNRVFNHSCETMPEIPDGSVHCCVTSPPYFGLRSYTGDDGMIGMEESVEEYIVHLIAVFREVWRCLRDDGTLWVNIGDCYANRPRGNANVLSSTTLAGRDLGAWLQSCVIDKVRASGVKEKDLIGIPWLLAFALRSDGWHLRSEIIWDKNGSGMPESVIDRPTREHETIFLLSKSGSKTRLYKARDTGELSYEPDLSETHVNRMGKVLPRWRGMDYYYDSEVIREPLAPSSVRLAQNIEGQAGSLRANGGAKTNGPLRAVATTRSVLSERHRPQKDGSIRASAERFVGGNKGSVWSVTVRPQSGPHPAMFPPDLIQPCILAGAPPGGIVLDPFMGSGTTADVALACGRNFVGYEISAQYCDLIRDRLGLFGDGVG